MRGVTRHGTTSLRSRTVQDAFPCPRDQTDHIARQKNAETGLPSTQPGQAAGECRNERIPSLGASIEPEPPHGGNTAPLPLACGRVHLCSLVRMAGVTECAAQHRVSARSPGDLKWRDRGRAAHPRDSSKPPPCTGVGIPSLVRQEDVPSQRRPFHPQRPLSRCSATCVDHVLSLRSDSFEHPFPIHPPKRARCTRSSCRTRRPWGTPGVAIRPDLA